MLSSQHLITQRHYAFIFTFIEKYERLLTAVWSVKYTSSNYNLTLIITTMSYDITL